MLFFGHLGIGSTLAKPWSHGLNRRWLLIGTILPDLIDKSLYYALSLITGKHGSEIGLISCTRTFGHTAIALFFLTILAVARRSKLLAALALGIATHLLLDNVGERIFAAQLLQETSSTFVALVFPFYGFHFAEFPFNNASEHLGNYLLNPFLLGSEAIGLALLFWEYWKTAHKTEILSMLHRRQKNR